MLGEAIGRMNPLGANPYRVTDEEIRSLPPRQRRAVKVYQPRRFVETVYALKATTWGLANLISGLMGWQIIANGQRGPFWGVAFSDLLWLTLIPLTLGAFSIAAIIKKHWRTRAWLAMGLAIWWVALSIHYLKYPPQAGGFNSYGWDMLVELWIWSGLVHRLGQSDE